MDKKPYSDKRWNDDPGFRGIQCNNCKHVIPYDAMDPYPKCKAYPNGIPRELFSIEFTHKKPYPGDNGIMYEEK